MLNNSLDVIRRKMIETRNRIDYFEERMCFIPASCEESRRNIRELTLELDRLAAKYHNETGIIDHS